VCKTLGSERCACGEDSLRVGEKWGKINLLGGELKYERGAK